jgi:hypothetical protein
MASVISNDSLKYLYDMVLEPGSIETDTAKLWMAVFSSEFSARDEVYCVQETSPAPGSRKRVDATVYRIVNRH